MTQSLADLHNLAKYYFAPTTTVRVYLAIKIWPRRRNGDVALMALMYRRANFNLQQPQPEVAVSFGTGPIHDNARVSEVTDHPSGVEYDGPDCDRYGIPQYQLRIPAMDLFDDTPDGVPPGTPDLIIDLFEIQQEVLKAL
jgi:hypothetical protein